MRPPAGATSVKSSIFDWIVACVLEAFAARASQQSEPGVEVYFVDLVAGPEPWRVGAHRVVQRRDAADAKVVIAAFPPGLKLDAGDSLDISTFRLIETDELREAVHESLFAQIPVRLHTPIRRVLEYLDQKGWDLTDSRLFQFLAHIGVQESLDEHLVGGALFALGLVPDFDVFGEDGDPTQRLGLRNLPIVSQLADQAATPVERIVALPVLESETDFRNRLRTLAGDELHAVELWGKRVATDTAWRDLALEHWLFADDLPPPGSVRIDILEPPLPRRDDGVLLLDPTSRPSISWQTSPAPLDVSGLEFFRLGAR